MATVERSPAIPPEVMAELEEAIEHAIKGIHDPEAMRRAAERMDQMREKLPLTNLAVELIREARGEE